MGKIREPITNGKEPERAPGAVIKILMGPRWRVVGGWDRWGPRCAKRGSCGPTGLQGPSVSVEMYTWVPSWQLS